MLDGYKLRIILEKYNENRSLSSVMFPHESIKFLNAILERYPGRLFPDDLPSHIEERLLKHTYNTGNKTTATVECVLDCLVNIRFHTEFDDYYYKLDFYTESNIESAKAVLLDYLKNASLSKGDNAQANFNTIVNDIKKDHLLNSILKCLKYTYLLTGIHAQNNISTMDKAIKALNEYDLNKYEYKGFHNIRNFLEKTPLLTGIHAQNNFTLIFSNLPFLEWTLSHFKYARNQAAEDNFEVILQLIDNGALKTLRGRDLLSGENAKANFKAITQNKGKYANDIAEVLFHYPERAYNDRSQLQVSFDILTKNACHAKDIANALEHFRYNYFQPVTKPEFHLLIQHGHCAKDITTKMKGVKSKGWESITLRTLAAWIDEIEIKKSTREIEKNVATLYTFFKFLPADLVTYIATMTGNKQYHNEQNAMDIAYRQRKIYDMAGSTLAIMINHHRLLGGLNAHQEKALKQQPIFDKQYGLTLYSNNKKHLPANDSTTNSVPFEKR